MAVLSKEELEALGVSIVESKYGSYYSIPCAICGIPVKSRTFSVNRAYKCKVCKNDLAKKRQAINKVEKEQADRLLASELGIDYTLKDTPVPTKEQTEKAEAILIK